MRLFFVLLALAIAAPLHAHELRVVSLNASNTGSATSGPRAGMDAILSAIGSSVSDDPTTPGNSGIARPIDVLCLQEARSSATTATAYAALLNQIYSTNRYAAGTLDGATSGAGTQAVVYNTQTVELRGEAVIGVVSIGGAARQPIRYQFRPRGFISASADVYIYNSHFKAGNSSSDRGRRDVEAESIRDDSDALGASRNVIYLGDFNVYRDSEAMYVEFLSTGNGQANDPIDQPGSWSDTSQFRSIHTQSPWDSALPSGFNGTSGGMDDRFDQQLVSDRILDGTTGLQYATNSYHAFGNNGSHAINRPINTGTAASPAVLNALAGILDHLPVVADYRLRPRLGLNHPGDANLDLITNTADFAIVASNFNTPADWFGGDFTGDGVTSIGDFAIFAANFNTTATARPVPEPAGVALSLVALVSLTRRR